MVHMHAVTTMGMHGGAHIPHGDAGRRLCASPPAVYKPRRAADAAEHRDGDCGQQRSDQVAVARAPTLLPVLRRRHSHVPRLRCRVLRRNTSRHLLGTCLDLPQAAAHCAYWCNHRPAALPSKHMR